MLLSNLHGPTRLCEATFARLTILLTRLCMPPNFVGGQSPVVWRTMLISSPHSFRCQDWNHSVVPAHLDENIIIRKNLEKSSVHFPLVAKLFLCLHESVCQFADAESKIWFPALG